MTGELGNRLAAGDWRLLAACRGADVELFFDRRRLAEARAFCVRCSVRAACDEAGQGEEGTWGGVFRIWKRRGGAEPKAAAS
ncbi:WhiB family transcriptional regulator [Dactylosporangium vinaceum]|nr:WhiB family transcriptional regulator [Dactylosporangium vinaceum]